MPTLDAETTGKVDQGSNDAAIAIAAAAAIPN